MIPIPRLWLVCVLVPSIAACSAGGAAKSGSASAFTDASELEPRELGSITRVSAFDGVLLTSQPLPADFERAKEHGVRTVIDLRHASEVAAFDEERVVRDLGMSYVRLAWNGPDELTDAVFDRARELLRTADRPVLVHCAGGNRTAALWIPWRTLDEGVELETAVAEARSIGLRTPAYEGKARAYVARHAPPG